jgi:hypothetical protein
MIFRFKIFFQDRWFTLYIRILIRVQRHSLMKFYLIWGNAHMFSLIWRSHSLFYQILGLFLPFLLVFTCRTSNKLISVLWTIEYYTVKVKLLPCPGKTGLKRPVLSFLLCEDFFIVFILLQKGTFTNICAEGRFEISHSWR